MKKYLLAFAALTWATFAWSDVPLGDIYSLTPIEGSGDNALVAGEKIQFKIRLLAKNLTDSGALAAEWSIVHTAIGSKEVDDLNSPLMIGIIVSGRLRGAKILSATPCQPIEPGGGDKSYPYTDLLCEYQVQPGDIARPVYLALDGSTEDNPIIPGSVGQPETRYYIWNSDKWAVKDTTGNVCTFSFCGDDRGSGAKSSFWGKQSDIGDYPTPDYDLAKANFNIQSVNFDENRDSENYWREVKEGTTETTYRPMIQTIGKPETSIRLYVWSENENVVVPYGANVTTRTVQLSDGSTRQIQMAEIKVISGETDYPFQIKGMKQGEATNLILSPTPGYRFNKVGETITNFVTTAVYCTEPPKPNLQICFDPANPTSSKTLTVDTSMKQVENLAEDAKPLYIVLSEKYDSDVTVSLVLTNVAKPDCNPITNLNLAVEQYGDSFSTMPDDRAYTNITIKAGETLAQVFLYPLGGTADTQSQGINIQPKILTEGAAEHFEVGQRALLKIRGSHKPTITTPEAGTNYDAQEPTGFTVPVGVADCYRDLNLKQGFKVDVDYSDGSKMTTTNVVFTENGEIPITLANYGINVTYANIKVTEPDGTAYATVKVYFTVKPQKTVTAALYDSTAAKEPHEGTAFVEGDTPIVRFTISEKKPAGELNNLYAFLVPQNEASSNLVDCSAFTEGVLIPGGQTESALSAYWKLELKDGTALTDGSKGQLSYKIMLRTSPEITGGVLEESYIDVDGLQFTVDNINSTLEGVNVNGDPTAVARDSIYEQTVAADTDIPFVVSMTDPSIVDQTNGLISIWMFTSGRSRISYNYSCVTSTTETAEMIHRFADPGTTQQVQVVAVDKDLLKSLSVESIKNESDLKTLWPRLQKALSEESFYKFKVAVDQAPMVILLPEEMSFAENIAQSELNNQLITVELNNPAPQQLTIRLSLWPLAEENPGSLKFDTTSAVSDPDHPGGYYVDLKIKKDDVVPTKQLNSFYVGGVKLTSTDLDGSSGSTDEGWSLEARVITESLKDEYSDGYGMVYVQNMPPVISPKQSDPVTTNKQLSVGESWKFAWSVKDIQADLDYVWPNGKKGIKCEWYLNDGLVKTEYASSKDAQETEIQINQEGLSVVKLVAIDKDGEDYNGSAERVWYFYIAPSKHIAVTPVGPVSNSKTKYFKRAGGLGQGRAWVAGNGYTLAGFQQTWNINVTARSASVYAYGYASSDAPYADDGSLGPASRDIPISPIGESADAEPYFKYDGVYDNYFYCWAYITPGASGAGSDITYSEIQPPLKPLAETREQIPLEEYDEKKTAYDTKQVEAIFSREYLTTDNLGDINLDGIPDYYLMRYPDFGVVDEDGRMTGDDLANLSKFNDDGDYLPNTMDAPYAAFVPKLSNTWVTAGRAFTARMEVRGWGNGLNNAPMLAKISGATPDRVYTNPQSDTNSTLAYVEWVAFTNYCEQAGIGSWEDQANWAKWSPERPTDPTKADTDGDGLPDGYEYYIWYKAHVGELVTKREEVMVEDKKVMVTVTNLVRYTGRKYNIVDPVHPIEISADDIEKLYDPITPNDQLADADTDLDGLPDLLEFEIGTNPFDYDTDHDGLPDGWEVAISKTDPLNAGTDNEKNEDGDVMAYAEMTFWRYEGKLSEDGPMVYLYSYGMLTNSAADAGYSHSLFTAFPYKPGKIKDGKQQPDDFALGEMIVNRNSDDWSALIDTYVPNKLSGTEVKLAVMHDQFLKYNLKPFDPRTGWNLSGGGTDSKAFSAYDEFMLLAFYLNSGEATLKSLEIEDDPHFGSEKLIDVWSRTTTDPTKADSNEDGVPDGWQLYVSWDHSVCGEDDPVVYRMDDNKKQSILRQIGPYSAGAPIFDLGAGAKGRDTDNDGLTLREEFCGVESCKEYEKCKTITNVFTDWDNKKWPTDPWNEDTDGDGMSDSEEHKHFAHNGCLDPLSWDTDGDGLPDPWEAEFAGTATISGSGANGAATDGNSNNATASATNTTATAWVWNDDGMDGTVKDADKDYDNDGLYNWQEYMVGTMRCWRYDDTTTPWAPGFNDEYGVNNGWGDAYRKLSEDELTALFAGDEINGHKELFRYFEDYWTTYDTKALMIDTLPDELIHNRGFRSGHIDPGAYFSCCKNEWDKNAYGRFYYFKDGIDHDLKNDYIQPYKEVKDDTAFNRWQAQIEVSPGGEPSFTYKRTGGNPIYPTSYISCNPKEPDTDFDGMDDFYELFHGLNPLLGAVGITANEVPCDIVCRAYSGAINATANYYLYWMDDPGIWITWNMPMQKDRNGAYKEGCQDIRIKNYSAYNPSQYLDFYQFPWLAGLPTADPDGDNIRNQQESILLKNQAASTYQHTDPTPLWMTDSSFNYSLTRRFYQATSSTDITPISYQPYGEWNKSVYSESQEPLKGGWFVHKNKVYHLVKDFPWLSYDPVRYKISVNYDVVSRFNTSSVLYSFEENEGYDSDHDYLSDFEESQGRTKPVSDPQQHDDPIRHQAMYFDGNNSRLQSLLEVLYPLPSGAPAVEKRQDFLYFTVEAWVKVDQANIDDGALHTVIERAIGTGESGPADETFLRKNFLIGVKDGKWYGKFDSTGTDKGQAVEITDGPKATTEWTHLTLTYGPKNGNEQDETQPMAFRLYVHDTSGMLLRMCEVGNVRLQPEHGAKVIEVDPDTKVGLAQVDPWMADNITIVIGASVMNIPGIDVTDMFGIHGNYFKGYIDEVRVWDGARQETEISGDVLTRYTSKLAEENRSLVFTPWSENARRTPMSPSALPPELRYHWAFDHLPSAIDSANLLTTPAGFTTAEGITDAKALWARPENYEVAWWANIPSVSSIFTNYAWVPWIHNTVAHLPCFDDTTFDSVYFSGTNRFPRTAEVWSKVMMQTSPTGASTIPTKLKQSSDPKKTSFDLRNRVTVGADLLPLGRAFPKRISAAEGGMWDDPSASDAWAEDGSDKNNNALPDWWEKYARKNYSPTIPGGEQLGAMTRVIYHGSPMTAMQAYLFDLASGMLSDGKVHAEYKDTRDTDHDGIPDWWEKLYGIQTNSPDDRDADLDNDGLSNYQEYLINLNEPALPLNPTLWTSFAFDYPDYFLKSTIDSAYYLGFKYTDHDFIENWFEGQTNGMDSAIYDPHLDLLGTGWDNWSRARAEQAFVPFEIITNSYENFDGDLNTSIYTNYFEYAGYPQPKIQLTVYGATGTTYSYYEEATSNETGWVTNTYAVANTIMLKAYQQGALVANFMVEGEIVGDHIIATIDGVGLKQGETVFVVENGGAVGFQKVNVGYDVVPLTMEVKANSSVIPAGAYSFSMGGITYIRRTSINGQKCRPRVVWAGTPADYVITEADIIGHPNCAFDLDWKYLVDDAKTMGIKQSDIQVATYEVGDSSYGLFFGFEFQKLFVGLDGTMAGFERPKATLVGAMPDGGNVRTVRPQFTFKGLEQATAFAIEVSTTPSTNGVFYSSINTLPVKTASGYVFTAPLNIGAELQDGSNYYWRVLGMNAKWSDIPVDEFTVTGDTTGTYTTNWVVKADDEWSQWDRFTTAVDSSNGTTGYGALTAKIHYFGAATNELSDVKVGVYLSADFASEPIAVLPLVAFDTEMRFDGLAEGAYYVMAFNDKNGNGQRDAWESWGYYNKVGINFKNTAEKLDYYTPVAVKVSRTKAKPGKADIYMEDTDWGRFNEAGEFVMGSDGIPDCIQGEPTVVDPEDIDLDWDGLTKSEEALWGTEPLVRDTDGDGFPDGYEVWAGMDPLNFDYTTGVETLADGSQYEVMKPIAYSVNDANDVMAYAIVTKHVYMISNVVSGTKWTVTPPKNDPFNGQYKLGMTLPTNVTYPTVGLYRMTDPYEETWAGAESGQILTLGGSVSVNANFVVVEDLGEWEVQLMHFEVMKEFGFISGLATAGDLEKGLRPATALDGTIGKVGTRPFFGIDKYLVATLFGDPTETFKDAKGQIVQAMEWSFTSPVKFNKMDYNRRWGKDRTVLSPFTADFDGDAIPDGWELYVAEDPSGSLILSPWKFMQDFKAKEVTTMTLTDGTHPTKLEYNGWFYFSKNGKVVRVNDPEWTLADMYNNGVNPANPYDPNSLLPGTGIEDKVARKYNIETPENQLADNDRDGLSNWAEYEGAQQYGAAFDVNDANSLTNRLDYWAFIKGTNTYAGAALTDHDFVEDDWEDAYQKLAPDGFYYASRYAADARADRDADGWSNYAEARIGSDPRYGTKQSLSSVASEGDFTTIEYPVPVIKTVITYDNGKDPFDAPLVIKAWRGTQANGDPDAVWNVAGLSDGVRINTRFLGRNPNRPMTINLGPGSVAEGSVKLTAFDPYYYTYTDTYETNGTLKSSKVLIHGFDTSKWTPFAFFDQPFAMDEYNFGERGHLDYDTGNLVIDFDSDTFQNPAHYWHVSGEAGMKGGDHVYETYNLANAYYRIEWRSRVVENGTTKTLYLSYSDEPSESNPCRGHLREGKNLFIVFADKNRDGQWSEDEPMGFVRDVDIGWSGTEIKVELTENQAPFERMVLAAPATPELSPDAAVNAETNKLVRNRLIISRIAIDGEEFDVPRRFIFKVDPAKRLWFCENDYVRRGEFDLDWRYLTEDAEKLGFTGAKSFHTVQYSVAYADDPETVINSFTRTFNTSPVAPALPQSGEQTVLSARPTLAFKTSEGYTAFTLQIATDEKFEKPVYETTDFMPPASSETLGRTFTPAISVGNGLENNTTYYWRVAQLNAKYRTNSWSETGSFRMAIDSSAANTGYGAIDATIGYFGSAQDPATNVIVGAWASPDFTGDPMAAVRLTNEIAIAKLATTEVKIRLDGLATGDYYLMAFVDANGNGLRDLDEKWGYVNLFGARTGAYFTPVARTASSTKGTVEVGAIIIEDNDLDLTVSRSSDLVNDSDGDGLTDDEEDNELGTDPYLWDTDGDGMPDGWENWAGTDPLTPDADYVVDGDLMAYLEKSYTLVTVWDGTDENTCTDYLLPADEKISYVGDAVAKLTFAQPYEYGEIYGLGTNVTKVAGKVYATTNTMVALVHDQVYAETGYKWPEYTKPFTALDKYLVLRYLAAHGYADEDEVNLKREWAKYTLIPGDIDNDRDGILDGWELYVKADPWKFADREDDDDKDGLTLVQEYDRGHFPTDPKNVDTDGDGVTDKYALMYHLKGDESGKDNDGDGLSNYAEYLITEVFKYAKCDPDNDRTNGHCVDYFLKVGSLYLGEIFTDHDQMDDAWEDKYLQPVPGEGDKFYASRHVYDAWKDYDQDGWSNYAEYRAGTDPSSSTALSIDGYTCPEYPMPAIEANVIYNGSDVITGPLVFKAWSEVDDYDMVKAPDAMWTLGTALQSTTKEGTSAGSETIQGSALQQHEKFLGRKPHGERTFYLTGGNIAEGTVKLLFLDKGYGIVSYDPITDMFYPVSAGEPDKALWYYLIIDKGGKLVRTGSSLYKAMGYEDAVVGTVDYKTGRITINFDDPELCGAMAGDPNEGESGSSKDSNGQNGNKTDANLYHWVDLDESYVRIEWKATQAAMAATGLHYFCDPDPVSADHKTLGHLREGKHSFVCFVDDDGNGEYTPGELFGFVRGVDVGWANAKLTVELTETHPIFGRVGFDGTNDRAVWYGRDSGNVTDMTYSVSQDAAEELGDTGTPVDSSLSGGKLQRVRIDRYAVNGYRIGVGQGEISIPDRVLVDKWINLNRSYLHEGDFMTEGEFDIDWTHFKEDILDNSAIMTAFDGEVQSVTYRVVVDNEDFVHPGVSNRVLNVAFTRWFDASKARKTPTGLKAMLVQGARPTFRWSMDGLNTYTAFKIRIVSNDGKNTTIYESPMTRTPIMDKDGNYVWEAPFYVGDQTPQGKVLARAGNYNWTVSMYNAKYQTDLYASPVDFVTSVNQQQDVDDYGFGSINVAVKYAGPVEVLKDSEDISKVAGKVRVQAFTTPDFSGEPAAQTFVADKAAVIDTLDPKPNVTIYGLPAGEYFIRAYIDSNGNFRKDDFESWGTPKTSVVIAKGQPAPTIGLYVEDADTDQDWIPDAWEYFKYHRLDHDNAKVSKNGEIVLKSTTYNTLLDGDANFSRFLTGASLAFFENFDAAKNLVPELASGTATDTISAIRDLIEKKVKPGTVKINSLVVDAANRKVILNVGGEVADNIAGSLLTPIYGLAAPTQVTISIYKKTSLLVNEWTWVKDVEVPLADKLDQTIEVPVDIDFNSGFYKVEVIQ